MPRKSGTGRTYEQRFFRAVVDCDLDDVDNRFYTGNFDESVFGERGEGCVLAQPPLNPEHKPAMAWVSGEIEAWLEGPEVSGKGLEAACLADLLGSTERGGDRTLVCWRVGRYNAIACIEIEGDRRTGSVRKLEGYWHDGCWFLLRKKSTSSAAEG